MEVRLVVVGKCEGSAGVNTTRAVSIAAAAEAATAGAATPATGSAGAGAGAARTAQLLLLILLLILLLRLLLLLSMLFILLLLPMLPMLLLRCSGVRCWSWCCPCQAHAAYPSTKDTPTHHINRAHVLMQRRQRQLLHTAAKQTKR
eukprot:770301-Rhodomonas_salina.1